MLIYDSRGLTGGYCRSPGEPPAPSGQSPPPWFVIFGSRVSVSGRRMGFHGKVINSLGRLPWRGWSEGVAGENR